MNGPRESRRVVIQNQQGLHLRPAEMFSRLARNFQAQVWLVKDTTKVDAKSILDLMMLAATEGTELTIEAEGDDAAAAVAALAELVEQRFSEE